MHLLAVASESMAGKAKKKDPGAVALAKKRADSLTPERRKEIAEKAAQSRWGKKSPKKAPK
jgi:hypothetical protein